MTKLQNITAKRKKVKSENSDSNPNEKKSLLQKIRGIKKIQLYIMMVPGLLYLILFEYLPIFGIVMAFQSYNPIQGFFGSEWVGLYQFERFVTSPKFWTLITNTLSISLWTLATFPLPIIFAMILNEVKRLGFKRTVQTIIYASHFISVTVLVGIMFTFFSPVSGIVNKVIVALGGESIAFMQSESAFLPMYVLSGLWQNMGWNTIIYIGALSSVSPSLHEAAVIDGAGRLKRMWHINVPSIIPTAVILFIMNVGSLMSVGFDKALLMQTAGNLEVSEIVSTYVYAVSLQSGLGDYSFGTAIGLFNAVINLTLLFTANFISKKLGQTSLW